MNPDVGSTHSIATTSAPSQALNESPALTAQAPSPTALAQTANGKSASALGPQSDLSSNGPSIGQTAQRLYEVEIGGTLLRLRSSHDQSTVDELVNLVNRKLKEAMPLTKSGSPQNASILASLNMAEEFLTWKKKAQAELDDLRRQAQSLLSELESTRLTSS